VGVRVGARLCVRTDVQVPAGMLAQPAARHRATALSTRAGYGLTSADFEVPQPWQAGSAKTITFIVTEACQLRCRYCYMVHKSDCSMSWEVARRSVDYVLTYAPGFPQRSVIWEFIGGEPFLEIELVDRVSDYIKRRMYELRHAWFDSYRFNFSTNGLLYQDPGVQRYIAKNHRHLDIGITIDGTRRKHDLNRVHSDGRGSYDEVVSHVPKWLEQFPLAATKVTVAHDDLPFLSESVLHLFELGIRNVNINCVFEPVWQPGDAHLFERQLLELADAMLDRGLYQRHRCSFFSRNIGHALDIARDNQNWCGAGVILAIDPDGQFLPCTRYASHCLVRRKPFVVGNCHDGLNTNRLRPFLSIDRVSQSSHECLTCEVASGCAWCQGANYDFADTATNFQRATYICEMHKARVRANEYFWHKLDQTLPGAP
jgi:uncharacterized protein